MMDLPTADREQLAAFIVRPPLTTFPEQLLIVLAA